MPASAVRITAQSEGHSSEDEGLYNPYSTGWHTLSITYVHTMQVDCHSNISQ